METTEQTDRTNLAELQKYYRELFFEVFDESESAADEWFAILWRKYKDELVFEMWKRKSKYLQS